MLIPPQRAKNCSKLKFAIGSLPFLEITQEGGQKRLLRDLFHNPAADENHSAAVAPCHAEIRFPRLAGAVDGAAITATLQSVSKSRNASST